jgi:flagellar hook-associated protein 2
MSRISSSVGLITGIPIEQTVNQLMEVASRPRKELETRTRGLASEQAAVDTLSTRLLGVQFSVNKLKSRSLFQTSAATSSDAAALKASVPSGKTPPPGSFQVRVVRTASAQQLISNRIDDPAAALGSGNLSFRVGGFVDAGRSLDELNQGTGVERGKIRVTDRSGASAVIDLSTARSVDDVLRAINASTEISVTAAVEDGSFVLSDTSGGSGTLRVAEVNGGTTAQDLGLGSVNVAANSATGGAVFGLHRGTKLASLNDGNGVEASGVGIDDLEFTLRDGTAAGVDLAEARTLGDVVDAIEQQTLLAGKVSVAIVDGKRLQVTDLTSGGGSFAIDAGSVGSARKDLGLEAAAVGGTIAGGRLVAGLKDTLLSSLDGGAGLGSLGSVSLTNRAGGAATVDLSSAETLDDVIDLINAAGVQITASFNASRNGIALSDASGGSGSLVVANADGSQTAAKLKIAVNAGVATVNSGSLARQTLSRATRLADLAPPQGLKLGDLRITDAAGRTATADLNDPTTPAATVGDVIDAINGLSIGVEARINDQGDGILVVDMSEGSGSLQVADASAGNLARLLRLDRASEERVIAGQTRSTIDGAAVRSVSVDGLGGSGPGAVLLADLRNGAGIARGDFVITDARGRSLAIDLNGADAGAATVDDLIDAINAKAAAQEVGVAATLNAAGTGIKLTDSSGGSGKLTVRDVGAGTAAADLRLAGEGRVAGVNQILDGAGAIPGAAAAETGLNALARRINEQRAGVTASVVFDGVGYRISMTADASGSANELLLDPQDTGLVFAEATQAQDALLAYGDLNAPGGGALFSSANNEFKQVIGGVDLTALKASDAPVSVNVTVNRQPVVDAVNKLVEDYNAARKYLAETTKLEEDATATGLLFGTNAALQVDIRLSRVLTDRVVAGSAYASLSELGLSLNAKAELVLDEGRLREAIDDDPEAARTFFTAERTGFAARLSSTIDGLAGDDSAVLLQRGQTLQRTIEDNQTRIGKLDASLERERERMLLEFARLESLIAKFQDSLSAIQNFTAIPPLSIRRSR